MFRLDLFTSCQAPLIMFACGLFCRFAYIVFNLKDSLSKALELNGSDYNGRVLRVDLAGEGGGGGGGGSGGRGGFSGRGGRSGSFGGRGGDRGELHKSEAYEMVFSTLQLQYLTDLLFVSC